MAESSPGPYRVHVQLTISPDIEESASCVVGASSKGHSVGEELDGIDVGFVTGECLNSLAGADIPEFGESITRSRHKDVGIRRVDAQTHDVAQMVCELGDLGAGLDVPQHTCHVARRSQDFAIVDEAAAREVTGVTREFTSNTSRAVARGEIVD